MDPLRHTEREDWDNVYVTLGFASTHWIKREISLAREKNIASRTLAGFLKEYIDDSLIRWRMLDNNRNQDVPHKSPPRILIIHLRIHENE